MMKVRRMIKMILLIRPHDPIMSITGQLYWNRVSSQGKNHSMFGKMP